MIFLYHFATAHTAKLPPGSFDLYCGLAVARRMMMDGKTFGHLDNMTEHWRRSSPELQITWIGLAKLKQRNNIPNAHFQSS